MHGSITHSKTELSVFDITLMETLPVAMMVAVDCRAGDCIASDPECTKKGFYMKFEDVQLSLEGDQEIVSNLVAKVILRYTKFEKYFLSPTIFDLH